MKNPMNEVTMLLKDTKADLATYQGKLGKLKEESLVLEGKTLVLERAVKRLESIVKLQDGWTCSPPKKTA